MTKTKTPAPAVNQNPAADADAAAAEAAAAAAAAAGDSNISPDIAAAAAAADQVEVVQDLPAIGEKVRLIAVHGRMCHVVVPGLWFDTDVSRPAVVDDFLLAQLQAGKLKVSED